MAKGKIMYVCSNLYDEIINAQKENNSSIKDAQSKIVEHVRIGKTMEKMSYGLFGKPKEKK